MSTTDQGEVELPTPTVRQLLLLSIPSVIIGVFTALALWLIDEAADILHDGIWSSLPKALGIDPNSGWWIFLILTCTGVAVGLTIWLIPGHAGPDSAQTELVSPPMSPVIVPSLALAAILGLAGGVSLGPENPIILINVSLLTERRTRGRRRVYLRYTDLVADWRTALGRVRDGLGLEFSAPLAPGEPSPVDDFISPELHRIRTGWNELDVPPALQQLAQLRDDRLLALAMDAAQHRAAVGRRLVLPRRQAAVALARDPRRLGIDPVEIGQHGGDRAAHVVDVETVEAGAEPIDDDERAQQGQP